MRYLRLIPLLLALTLLAPGTPGQGGGDEFVSGQARFAIRPPVATRPVYRGINDEFGGFSVFGDGYAWSDESRRVEVIHLIPWKVRGTVSLSAPDKSAVMLHYGKQFKDEFGKDGARVVERRSRAGDTTGTELEVSSGDTRMFVRQFFQADRFYILVAQKSGGDGIEDLKRVLDTFRRLDLDEYNAAMIRETEPAALPQTVPTGVHSTDAIERGLKGKVERILETIESGTSKKRVLASEELFSRLGYLTRRVTYNEGYVESIANYGWVDGVRAVNRTPVTHRGERSIAMRGTFIGWGMPEGYNVITRTPTGQLVDLRFTSKFESSYDDDWRLVERREFSSSGNISLVESIGYSGTGRDIRTEDSSGGFITRRFEVLDKQGNVSEIRTLDDRGNALSTLRFRYRFDASGNWIFRTATATQRPGVPKPNSATVYRSIEYYD